MSTHEEINEDKGVFGMWIYIMSDCVLFAALFAAYAVLQTATFGSVEPADFINLPFVVVETLLLLTSSFTAGIAVLCAQAKDKVKTMWALGVTLALGLLFVAMEVYEFRELIVEGHGPDKSAFLSSFFTLVGTHGLHVTLGSLWLVVLMTYIYRKGFTVHSLRRLAAFSLFWHFLDIVWICIFTFVYLFGLI